MMMENEPSEAPTDEIEPVTEERPARNEQGYAYGPTYTGSRKEGHFGTRILIESGTVFLTIFWLPIIVMSLGAAFLGAFIAGPYLTFYIWYLEARRNWLAGGVFKGA